MALANNMFNGDFISPLCADLVRYVASYLRQHEYLRLQVVNHRIYLHLFDIKTIYALYLRRYFDNSDDTFQTRIFNMAQLWKFRALTQLKVNASDLDKYVEGLVNHSTLRKLTLYGDGCDHVDENLHHTNINHLELQDFGSSLSPFSWSQFKFCFKNIEYLYFLNSYFQFNFNEGFDLNTLFAKKLKGYGNHHIISGSHCNHSFTNLVLSQFNTTLKSIDITDSHKINKIPFNKQFNQLQELRVFSPQNGSNLIDKILSSTKSLQRFTLQYSSKIIKNRLRFMRTIQTLLLSQPNLYEISFMDEIENSYYIHDALAYALYAIKKPTNKINLKMLYVSSPRQDLSLDATQININSDRLNQILCDCYTKNNYRLSMEYRGNLKHIIDDLIKKNKSNPIYKLKQNDKFEVTIDYNAFKFNRIRVKINSPQFNISQTVNSWICPQGDLD